MLVATDEGIDRFPRYAELADNVPASRKKIGAASMPTGKASRMAGPSGAKDRSGRNQRLSRESSDNQIARSGMPAPALHPQTSISNRHLYVLVVFVLSYAGCLS